MRYLKNPDLFDKMGIKPPHGVLLEGPPGCGKVSYNPIVLKIVCVKIATQILTCTHAFPDPGCKGHSW